MKKSLIQPIKSAELANILNEKQTILILKRVPKWVLAEIAKGNSVDVYCYCTKAKPYLAFDSGDYDCDDMGCSYQGYYLYDNKWSLENERCETTPPFNGLVPCSFTLRTIVEFEFIDGKIGAKALNEEQLARNMYLINNYATQLTYEELQNYLGNKKGLALHISDLEIFDKPMELREFYKYNEDKSYSGTTADIYDEMTPEFIPLTRAPQSMQTVWVDD